MPLQRSDLRLERGWLCRRSLLLLLLLLHLQDLFRAALALELVRRDLALPALVEALVSGEREAGLRIAEDL